ncbi:MAG: hypothetical protein HY22_05575 [[Candidatus Thermochlorobacteriaceae] bacterium GBChlB]|nr:MAG: hypothetical protein HY22_05575 [[Candidatus Thermochlorobacteriaceae] bacterium GBChlB]
MKPELKVGLTVAAALLVLGGAIWWAKDVKVGEQTATIVFPNVSGLNQGDPVMINGLKSGKVQTIALAGRAVEVTILLDPTVVLYQNAVAQLMMLELMTGKKIELDVGSPDAGRLAPDGKIRGIFTADIPQLVGFAGDAIDTLRLLVRDLQSVVGNANAIIGDASVQEDLKISVRNLRVATTDLAILARDLRGANIKQLLANIDRTINTVETLVKDLQPDVKGAVGDVRGTLKNADALIASLSELTNKLKTDKQTLVGRLLNDEKFTLKLDSIVNNLDSLLKLGQKDGMKVQLRLF